MISLLFLQVKSNQTVQSSKFKGKVIKQFKVQSSKFKVNKDERRKYKEGAPLRFWSLEDR